MKGEKSTWPHFAIDCRVARLGSVHTRSHTLRGNAVFDAPRPLRGTPKRPLRATPNPDDAERRGRHSHAERGNECFYSSLPMNGTLQSIQKWTTKGAAILLIGCLAGLPLAVGDDSPLSLADLEAYRVALASKPDSTARSVSFRDLWDRPEDYAGRTVAVEGRVARTFRQPRFGEFPPLVEAWVVSPPGDPFCLVFPQPEGRPALGVGAFVRFSGTFLKRIKYQGGDVDRLAPLIVGPRAPDAPLSAPVTAWKEWSSADWMMAVGALLVVSLVLLTRHFSRPAVDSRPIEPPPSFVDGKSEIEGDFDET
jgi:hypothetical protein